DPSSADGVAGYRSVRRTDDQSAYLEQVAHHALVVRLAIRLKDVLTVRVEPRPAMPEPEVVSELVHQRRRLHEIGPYEIVPQDERDHEIAAAAAAAVADARRA